MEVHSSKTDRRRQWVAISLWAIATALLAFLLVEMIGARRMRGTWTAPGTAALGGLVYLGASGVIAWLGWRLHRGVGRPGRSVVASVLLIPVVLFGGWLVGRSLFVAPGPLEVREQDIVEPSIVERYPRQELQAGDP